MKIEIEKVFPLEASADSAWQLMQDIEGVAGCMPGAKITERVDDTHYKGTIVVKLGPATMSFKGTIEVVALDSAARSLHLTGKGADATGTSAASMDLVASVQAKGATCELTGRTEVTASGKAAALGGRLMGPVADQMLKQFVANFAARLQAVAPAVEQTPAEGGETEADAPVAASRPQPLPAANTELNGLALIWAVLRDWLRGLFTRKTLGDERRP